MKIMELSVAAQTEASHECRMNPSLFPCTCLCCLEKLRSDLKLRSDRRNVHFKTMLKNLNKDTHKRKLI